MDEDKCFSSYDFSSHVWFTICISSLLALGFITYLMFVHFIGEKWWVYHHEVKHLCMSVIAGCFHGDRPDFPSVSILG